MKTKRSRVFIIIILLLAVAVVLYAILLRDPSVDTPSVILPTAMPTAGPGGPDGGGDVLRADVTPETVQAVVAELRRANSYSRRVTIEDYWEGGGAESELIVWVHNGSVRIRGEAEGRNVLLLSDGRLYIWYDDSGEVYSGLYSEGDGDAWLRNISYETLLDLPAERITDAGYEKLRGESCIFAEYSTPNFGYRCVAHVSASTGLLMGTEVWDGDELIYRMSSDAPDLSTPDEGWFEPPLDGSDGEGSQ